MSFTDYALARKHLVEQRINTRIRQQAREQRAIEDAQFARSAKALKRIPGASDLG